MMGDYLTDERWALIASRLPGKAGDPGCHGRDNRLFVEAVFWVARTGSPWRALPPRFGKWYSNYTRFRRWAQRGVWPSVLQALAADGTREYFFEGNAIRHAAPHSLAPEEASAAASASPPSKKAA